MKTLLFAVSVALCASANATTYYFADCGTGKDPACVIGNDGNSGTSPTTPYRTSAKFQAVFNAAMPGDRLLLAKGGAWDAVAVTLHNVYSGASAGNLAAMAANPVVVDSYTPSWGAGTAKPRLNGPTTGTANRSVTKLIDELERMPAEQSAAVQVLWMADDPNSSSEDLARVVSADPALTSRIMRIANSAFYGLSGKIRSSAFAVTVLGFSTVRSLAAAVATGALNEPNSVPPSFWLHAAANATAASVLAPRIGAKHQEAFSLGILHDLGCSLLYRTDPEGYRGLIERVGAEDGAALQAAERELFGIDHAQAVARVLAAWRFPDDFVDALATHHDPLGSSPSVLARTLTGGEVLARLAMEAHAEGVELADEESEELPPIEDADVEALAAARVPHDAVPGVVAQVQRGFRGLADAISIA